MGVISTLKYGFCLISFEKMSVLDLYFIHGYIIIKYRLNLILSKIHQLFLELWPFFNVEKQFPFDIF